MAKKNLPMGEERDALRDGADKVLSKGQSVRRTFIDDDDDDALPPARNVLTRSGAMTYHERQLAEDRRIMAERSAPVRNPFGGQPAAATSGDTWNSPYIRLGGVTLTKKQLMAAINDDIPRLLDEAGEQTTVRGKFLRSVLIPVLRDGIKRNKMDTPPAGQGELPL